MTKEQILDLFKSSVVKSHLNNNPSLNSDELTTISKSVDQRIMFDTPLSAVGLDSITMIWIMVQFDNELNIDTSSISFFELNDVNDLCDKVHGLIQ
jgi:acyl carrier protein